MFVLQGHFPDNFPAKEDPVPSDDNPHPVHGVVIQGNHNVEGKWMHDLVGAG